MDKKQPLVSVVTVVYNGAACLERTIQSVLRQSYTNLEYIIIDGGSKDGTVDIIKKYEQDLTYWISEPDKGLYYAMNKGIAQAKGEWINFMNAGDWFYDEHAVAGVFADRDVSGYDMIYGNTEKRKADSTEIYAPGNETNFWKQLMIHQSTFSRTELNRKYQFDTRYKVSADFNFLCDIFFNKHKTLHVETIISSFDMVGFSHNNRYRGFKEDIRIALRHKGNIKLTTKVSLFYVYIIVLGKCIDFSKRYFPKTFRKIKSIKDKDKGI